ncbi:Proline synthetase co-transcribed protein [Handroanthus impetiginosus]|uniref:Pyridoxal phosphate homeostasis protein n=1 Tax=Handroanthus impetiginosus TaxID=429701 RepID=A0A2G9HXY1_9LAMI|nr:Proline synthetase co-transcribed protein [Handroanthus impetiginosus]
MNNPDTEEREVTQSGRDSLADRGLSSSSPGLEMAAASATDGVAAALRSVLQRAKQAAERSGRRPDQIRVVAVSKTKPVPILSQAYDAGHRCFGENYVQELVEKAPQLPEDIGWHFIGNLQSNKVKPLLTGVPNLAMVETVDDEKIANHLNRAIGNIGRKPLKVLIQVNTSGEESKSGVEPAGCVELAKHVSINCPNLEFCGLMTIGMPDYTSTPENFKTLANCRSEVCKALGMPEEQCELSMGMSGDFELAIEMGSTNVRIGSTIFGAREYPKKQLS